MLRKYWQTVSPVITPGLSSIVIGVGVSPHIQSWANERSFGQCAERLPNWGVRALVGLVGFGFEVVITTFPWVELRAIATFSSSCERTGTKHKDLYHIIFPWVKPSGARKAHHQFIFCLLTQDTKLKIMHKQRIFLSDTHCKQLLHIRCSGYNSTQNALLDIVCPISLVTWAILLRFPSEQYFKSSSKLPNTQTGIRSNCV